MTSLAHGLYVHRSRQKKVKYHIPGVSIIVKLKVMYHGQYRTQIIAHNNRFKPATHPTQPLASPFIPTKNVPY